MYHTYPPPGFIIWPDLGASGAQILEWAECTIESEANTWAAVNAALASSQYFATVQLSYSDAIQSDPHLARLETFRETLVGDHGKLFDCVGEALLEAKPAVNSLVTSVLQEALYTPCPSPQFLMLRRKVSMCIAKHVIQHIKSRALVIPSSFRFVEDSATAGQRADLLAKLSNFEEAAAHIAGINTVICSDSYEDEVVDSLLKAAAALDSPITEGTALTEPTPVSTLAAAWYDELAMHSSGSPTYSQAAQLQAQLEEIPVSPSASDFSYVNVS